MVTDKKTAGNLKDWGEFCEELIIYLKMYYFSASRSSKRDRIYLSFITKSRSKDWLHFWFIFHATSHQKRVTPFEKKSSRGETSIIKFQIYSQTSNPDVQCIFNMKLFTAVSFKACYITFRQQHCYKNNICLWAYNW